MLSSSARRSASSTCRTVSYLKGVSHTNAFHSYIAIILTGSLSLKPILITTGLATSHPTQTCHRHSWDLGDVELECTYLTFISEMYVLNDLGVHPAQSDSFTDMHLRDVRQLCDRELHELASATLSRRDGGRKRDTRSPRDPTRRCSVVFVSTNTP